MMRTRLSNARLVDPTQPHNGKLVDIVIEEERIQSVTLAGQSPQRDERALDMSGCLALAGGLDLHTHIGGGKVNLARLLMQERLLKPIGSERGPLWSTVVTGRKYAEMGYTACFEPAMLLPQARATHCQLADTPLLDSGAYVVMGNEDWLLESLGRGLEQPLVEELVAWTVASSQALAVKVVNAGGINAFKFDQRRLDIDQPHPLYGATPRDIIRRLSAAVDELGLPHPLHVHASNLGMPGSIASTLVTLDAAEGRRLHLTHAQFNAYSDVGPYGMGSGAVELAERINRSPELTLDVGQIVFGQTVTISADTQAQARNRHYAHPAKGIISDAECVGGCGVVPMRYENKHYVGSLQWTIGLELLLLIRNPYQVFLTTDHPNGGPFTSYPHLIRLLMDRSFRQSALANIQSEAAERSVLKDLDREYTLDEIAIITRAAPARLLGLADRGQVRPGGLADLVFYEPKSDWEATFARAKSVWKSGCEIVRGGQIVGEAPTAHITARSVLARASGQSQPAVGQAAAKAADLASRLESPPLAASWREAIESSLRMPIEALEVSADEIAERIVRDPQRAGPT
ncbi:MAG: formylmethanofuran dehydrogenase subunit A [Aureliella sp.]